MDWRKAPTAKDLIGMEPDELKQKLDSAASKADLEGIIAANNENKTTLQQIKESLAALTTPKPPDTPVDPNADDPAAVRLLADPDKFVDGKMKGVINSTLQAQADLREMQARQTYGPVFAKYGKELADFAKTCTLDYRARPDFWDYTVRAVVGDKAIKGDGANYPTLLGPSSVAPRSTDSPDNPEQELGPEMAAWLRARGVPLEKAVKIRNLMHRDGETITHENYFGKRAN